MSGHVGEPIAGWNNAEQVLYVAVNVWNGSSWERWDGGGGPAGGGLTDAELRASPVPVSAAQSGAWNIGTVATITNPVAVTGTFWQATQPVSATDLDVRNLVFATDKVDVSGSTLAANSGVDIGDVTINNAAGASAVNIQDGGNTITVDGTVSANQGTAAGGAGAWPVTITNTADTVVKPGDAVNSAIRVNVVAGSGGGVTHTDDEAFTVASDDGVPAFGLYDDTSTDTVNEGDAGILRMSAKRELLVRGDFARPVYIYNIPSQVHVAAANTVHWDMFNNDASLIVRIVSIRQRPNITTAVTGIVFDWLLERTTAVGTGGSALTAWLADLSDTALDADITARSKPTGGATQSTDLVNYSLSSEETNAATIQIASQGGLELVPLCLQPGSGLGGKGIVLRQGQGIRCVQVTNSAAGNTGWIIGFTVE